MTKANIEEKGSWMSNIVLRASRLIINIFMVVINFQQYRAELERSRPDYDPCPVCCTVVSRLCSTAVLYVGLCGYSTDTAEM